jgi:hypothetical protein
VLEKGKAMQVIPRNKEKRVEKRGGYDLGRVGMREGVLGGLQNFFSRDSCFSNEVRFVQISNEHKEAQTLEIMESMPSNLTLPITPSVTYIYFHE